ncbi:MAG: uracil-DNA glycosylase [Christensenella sp.]|nr:uracil-DNA glycosylase [Christensenella sp.]
MTQTNTTLTLEALLQAAYSEERERLLALAQQDDPQGEYRSPVFGEGGIASGALLIGEAPGAEETKLGRPFVGKAGKQLDELIALFGVKREALYISNTVKYRPVVRSLKSVRNRTPLPAEVAQSLPLLRREIELLHPRVILTLGNTPLKAIYQLAGQKPPVIGAVHGAKQPLCIGEKSVLLIPLYHPASGIYNRSLVAVMEQDAVRAGEVIRQGS